MYTQPIHNIKSLDGIPLEQVRQTLVRAFANYSVPMQPTLEEFRQRMERNAFSPKLSVGVFEEDDLIGFVLTGVAQHKQIKTAYNAGTGVLAEHRGKKLTHQMYNFISPFFREAEIKQGLLEVITTNEGAIKSYRNVGFEVERTLECFVLEKSIATTQAAIPLKIAKTELPDWELYRTILSYTPSWQFTIPSILRNQQHEMILEATSRAQFAGFISFTPHAGKVSQLGVAKDFQRKGVATQLLRAAQALSKTSKVAMLNIESDATPLLNCIKKNNFKPLLNQYEMKLWL